jgi:uncharacterized phage protein gp47/JayE
MNFGISSEGFLIKRLPDIIDEITTALKDQFGNIDSGADSVFGQIIGVLAKPIADLWELAEKEYFSRYPDTAEGISLDYAAGITGAVRLDATYSRGVVGLHGTVATIVPNGTQLSTLDHKNIFLIEGDTEITNVDIQQIYVSVETAASGPGEVYSVIINSIECGLTSAGAMTVEEIAAQVALNIVAAFPDSVSVFDCLNGTLLVFSLSMLMTVALTADILSWSTPGLVTSQEIGAVAADDGEIVNIETPVSGLDSVINYEPVEMGRDLETDIEFRKRRLIELMISGAATAEAIRSKIIQGVTGVTDCQVFENDTDSTVGIMTPHSIHVVLTGGDEQAIAEKIWLVKAAGIETIGSISKTVIDSEGLAHVIKFSRAYTRYAWVYAILTVFTVGDEEVFPVDGVTQVKDKIKDYGDTINLGYDLLIQRFFKPINEVVGVESTDLYICLPQYTLTIIDESYADLTALIAYLTTLRAPTVGELFAVLGSGDTIDNALATAKGSAVVENDVFAISGISPAAVTYVGNLLVDPTTVPIGDSPYVQYNQVVSPLEHSEFSLDRIIVTLAP